MRVGFHPLKKKGSLEPPKDITVQMVTFVPFLSGYFEQSLDVLKLSLQSLRQNTTLPYDLMVFDNGSCAEVRSFLLEEQALGRLQYLFLSKENVGLPGAWNALFRAAPGKIVAYSDSDIYFYPGWLEACLRLLETYPKVGMVTGIPVRNPPQYNTQTEAWAQATPGVNVQRGNLIPWDIYWTHARSSGYAEEQARQKFAAPEYDDLRLEYQGAPAFIGAGHFQFVSPRAALNAVAPFPHIMPMGNERYLDEHINQQGYLRLTTTDMVVRHIGNRILPEVDPVQGSAPVAKQKLLGGALRRVLDIPLVKKVLLAVYNRIFKLYYERS